MGLDRKDNKAVPLFFRKTVKIELPVLNTSAIDKWINGANLQEITLHSDTFKPALTDNPNAFFIPVVNEYIKSGYASEGFRKGDLLLVEPTKKIKFQDRVLVKVAEKGLFVCYLHKLPSTAIKAVYEESKNDAKTILLEKNPLSFIANANIFIGSENLDLKKTEIFRLSGLYRKF